MSEARPKLEVVPDGDSRPGSSEPVPGDETPRVGRWSLWALLGLLAVALLGLALENRRATGLVVQVGLLENAIGELETELSAAEAAVSAHRAHLGDLRSIVSELSELVKRDPEQGR
ncbi:MAG: hypothetical protein JRH16_03450 [Deltaproteobacteria bacterium]|nr:hypothetical protein [Deltaproteobacteria bacterium]MBW2360222.1 hypothetical protein [Deltaproteobacteria bacterium]